MAASPSRRKFLRDVAGASAAVVTSQAVAQTSTTTTTSAPATTQAAPIDDVAAMSRLTGHDYSRPELELMAEDVESNRKKLLGLHERPIDPRTEPAVHFDVRLPGVAYPSGDSSFMLSDGDVPEYNGDVRKLAFASAVELSRLIHAGRVTSEQLTEMYLERLATIGRRLNAVITLTRDLAMKQAKRADRELASGRSRGPLHGIPYGAKDLLATKDIPTTWGVKPFEQQYFEYDATVIKRLDDAGAVLCAKLSLGELAMGDVWFGGRTRSPWDPKQGSGGSSAGPAAAVAGGLVAFAIGSETMGSIVSPCMTNGVVGLRPTYGRVSRYGAMALSRTMDKLGPMCRGVEDCAMVLSAIEGPDALDPTAVGGIGFRWDPKSDVKKLRVGYDVAVFESLAKSKNTQKRAMYEQALSALRGIVGGELVPVRLPDPKPYTGVAGMIIAVESASSFTELVHSGKVRELVQQHGGAWPNTFRAGSLIPASDYLRAMQVRTQLMRAYHGAMKDVDVYVTIPYAGSTVYMTNATGHPTLIARCGILDGRPQMLEFLAQPFREDAALRVAHAYEQVTSWHKTWPSPSA
jgi:Asp-tRNA(Asn)/Glu-tRNA(Gln) amidotransferase A subunit family amidase